MKKYPFEHQEDIKSCGVACIQMIVEYYKGYVPAETLYDMTKTNKSGTTAYNIKKTLIELGFEAKGIKCELDNINNNIILPCIANVTIDNTYKHFIVIYEINTKNKYLLVADPADKIKKISFIEFNKIFNNVLIIMYPKEKIPVLKNISLMDFIIKITSQNKKGIINLVLLSLFITLFSILTSFYTESMLNLLYYSKHLIIIIYFIFFSLYFLKILSDYFRNYFVICINQKIDYLLTTDTFSNIMSLPYHYFHSRTTGDVLSRINDLESLKDIVSKIFLTIFIDMPLTIAAAIILYFVSHTLFIIGLIMFILYILILLLFKNTFKRYISKIQKNKSDATSYMVESISGIESIKGVHIEKTIVNKFKRKYIKLLNNIFQYQKKYFIQNTLKNIIDSIGFITIILVGCILIMKNKLTIGSLMTFTYLLNFFLEPIKSLLTLDVSISESKNILKRVLELNKNENNDGFIDEFVNGDIEFKNLNYSFNDRDYVLNNINLKIEKNTKTMVIGKSGSGKSTLLKTLLKYSITKDSVFINDININNYKNSTLNNNVVYIGQNEMLFTDTIYNNLVIENSDNKKLLNATKICCVDEILDKNLGYNTLIEENGFNLSGGEKQRIILARGLIRNFNILIIDEGLSQVDINMERKILKNLLKEYKEKTIIFISHRLDNLDLFDNLLELENGTVKRYDKYGRY